MRGHIHAYPLEVHKWLTGDGASLEISGRVYITLPDGTERDYGYDKTTLEKISNLVGKLTIGNREYLESFVTRQVAIAEKLEKEGLKRPFNAYESCYVPIIDEEAELAEEEAERVRRELRKRGTEIFVRFGTMPRGGKSYNYRDKTSEVGVSVFKAVLSEDKKQVFVNLHSQHALGTYLTVCDRPLYRVYGTVVGEGADGEPCVKATRAINLKDATIEMYSEPIDE